MITNNLGFKDFYINEMAAPLSHHKEYTLYHGTDEKSAREIIQSGNLRGRIVQGKKQLDPVAGYVYTSKDLMYAVGYAGAYTEWGYGSSQKRKNGTEDFTAYIFVVDQNDVKDILVDEDSLGEIATSNSNDKKYSSEWIQYLKNLAIKVATPTQLKKAKDGEYSYQAAIGKKMHKQIPENIMQKLIDDFPHLALKGEKEVPIKGYYTIKKSVSNEDEFFKNAKFHKVDKK